MSGEQVARSDQTLRDYLGTLVAGWRDGTYSAESVMEALEEGLAQPYTDDSPASRPFSEMTDTGVLWAINRSLFHPRGFAFAVHLDTSTGVALGWEIVGDGSEPYSFGPDIPEAELMRAFEALLEQKRGQA